MRVIQRGLGVWLALALPAWGSDRLQLHFIDVGQGDAELVVSPGGQTILIDGGLPGSDKAVNAYLQSHGITQVDYYVSSHYHRDHLGCVSGLLTPPVVNRLLAAYDRGDSPTNTDSYATTFSRKYRAAVSGKRITVRPDAAESTPGRGFTLDAASNQPVRVEFLAANGNGLIQGSRTINENDLSVAMLVRFGGFSAVLGGDLSGSNGSDYTDIESSVARGFLTPVTVYKVHHHGSGFSSNTNWLAAINPVVGIICCGTRNSYGLPEAGALDRLAEFKVATYWTESGSRNPTDPGEGKGATHLKNGSSAKVERLANPQRHQRVGGDIRIEVAAGASTFDLITHSPPLTNTYSLTKPSGEWGQIVSPTPPIAQGPFVWSMASTIYHVAGCPKAALISPKNLQSSPVPPAGRTPHSCVGQ